MPRILATIIIATWALAPGAFGELPPLAADASKRGNQALAHWRQVKSQIADLTGLPACGARSHLFVVPRSRGLRKAGERKA